MPRSRLLSTGQAAREIGVALRTMQRWMQEGSIRPTLTTAGGHHRFDLDDLLEQLDRLQRDR